MDLAVEDEVVVMEAAALAVEDDWVVEDWVVESAMRDVIS